MPYSLNFASGGTVSFTPKALMGTWAWEIELEIPDTSNQRVINFNNNNFRYLRADAGFWELRNNLAGLPNVTSTSAAVTNTRTVIRVEATADEVSWFVDGTPQGVVGTQTNDFILNNLNNTGNFTGKVYRFEVWENGILVESRIKQTLTSGNDRVYTDNVGTNDGALDAAFPADNSQWELFDAPTGLTVSVTESTSDFSESSTASFTAALSAQVTEVSASFTESSSATITNNIVSVSVTETSQDFSESASTSISGSLSAIVTELSQSFAESSTAEISANISAAITELAQDFDESAQVNLVGSFTVEVTETTSDFEEACYVQLPMIRLTPRKTISVSNRRSSTIRVRSRNNVIRVK